MGEIVDRRIFETEGDPSTYQDGQTGFDDGVDADLGFVMFCGKDHNSDIIRMLAKDKPAQVQTLSIINDDFQFLFEDAGNVGVLTATNTVTSLGQLKFLDDLLTGGSIAARFADSTAEATAFVSDFGDSSIMGALSWLKDNGGANTLQEAYEGGPGIAVTDALGALSITGDVSDTTELLALTSLNGDTGGDVVNLHNDNPDACAIYFNGDAGDGDESSGHLLKADGSISLIGNFSTNGQAFFNAQKYTGEGTTVYGILRAEDTGSDAGEVKVSSDGNVNITSTDDIILNSASTIQLDATSYITCQDTSVRDVQNISYNDTLTYVNLSSGVANINWNTGTNIQRIDLDANCTQVSMSAPAGPAELHLIFENTASAHTITNFTNTTWYGDSDPDTTPYNVPANENVIVKLIYDGSGYHAWLIGEV
jgi:hypothetical protein